MIRSLTLLGLLAAIGVGAVWLAELPGQLRIDWQGWQVEISPGVLILALCLLAGIVAVGTLLLRFVWKLPRRAITAWQARRARRGWRSLEIGLTAVAGGDERGVRSALKGVRVLPTDAPLRMLLEAQAAELANDESRAHSAFSRMEEGPRTQLVALRGLVAELRRQGNLKQALKLAESAASRHPSARWASEECLDLSLRLHRWDQAKSAVKHLQRREWMTPSDAVRARGLIEVEDARVRRTENDHVAAARSAQAAVSLLPRFGPAATIAAEVWLDSGRAGDARRVLRAAWASEPHPDLAFLLLRASGASDALASMEVLEDVLAQTPNSIEGCLALAEVALNAKLYGVARKYLDLVRHGPHDERVYRMLAELERAEGSDPDAVTKWLVTALDAKPAPAWVCASCAKRHERWRAVCERCGAFDRVSWRTAAPEWSGEALPRLQHQPVEPAAIAGATP